MYEKESIAEQIARWDREKKERRKLLSKRYPNKLIQKIDVEHLRKIGYAIGIGSTDTKREFIDKIIQTQVNYNAIIIKNDNGEFILNREADLLYYIIE
jgi:hypothetical protein